MACNPPFNCPGHEGTGGFGGFCDCDCGCCASSPPCPCYTSIVFNYAEYCGGEELSGNINGAIGLCATVDFGTITNTFLFPAIFKITGGVDDDVLFNDVIYEDGKYPFFPPNYCGAGHGTNGSHSFSYTKILNPGESINVKGRDNGFGGSLNANWTLTSSEGATITNYSVTVSFSGCCMSLDAAGEYSMSFVAINSGNVTITNNYSGLGLFECFINGDNINQLSVNNCDSVSVTWGVVSDCPISFLNTVYNLVPSCITSPFIKIKNKITGLEKIYLNKNKIIEKIRLQKMKKLR